MRAIPIALLAAIALASTASAQRTLALEWRAAVTVVRWTGAPGQALREDATSSGRRGSGMLSLAPAGTRDAAFLFEFRGPDGAGSGVVLPGAEGALDPNFAFPTPLPPGLPPASPGASRGTMRLVGDPERPSRVELTWTESFMCRSTPKACGNVKRWDVTFTATGRPAPGLPSPAPR